MNPQQLVPTLETCEHLSRIGFPQDTYFCYNRAECFIWTSEQVLKPWRIAAPTLQELLDIMEPVRVRFLLDMENLYRYFVASGNLWAANDSATEAAALLYIKLHMLSNEQSPVSPHSTINKQNVP